MTFDEMVKLTGKRSETFEIMMKFLSEIENPLIVETGCMREENNFDGDGMSTLIFDTYCSEKGGEFWSVDLDQKAVDFAKSKVKVGNVVCSDSITFLRDKNKEFLKEGKKIDLLYLDSFDLDPDYAHPSSLHHILELTAIIPSLKEGTMVVVDDNIVEMIEEKKYKILGKGTYVAQYFQAIDVIPTFIGYQWGWILK